MSDPKFKVTIDGETWAVVSEQSEYDIIHAVAGAVLAGADRIEIINVQDTDK